MCIRDRKSSLSVIEGILCKAGQGLSLTGYNMETAITLSLIHISSGNLVLF